MLWTPQLLEQESCCSSPYTLLYGNVNNKTTTARVNASEVKDNIFGFPMAKQTNFFYIKLVNGEVSYS
jgi:hypothetical protein